MSSNSMTNLTVEPGQDRTAELDTILPFPFYVDHEAEMLAAMRQIKESTGIRHFLLTAPAKSIRITGYPDDDLYHAIATLIERLRKLLEPEGFIISWWNVATLKVGPGAPYPLITPLTRAAPPPCLVGLWSFDWRPFLLSCLRFGSQLWYCGYRGSSHCGATKRRALFEGFRERSQCVGMMTPDPSHITCLFFM